MLMVETIVKRFGDLELKTDKRMVIGIQSKYDIYGKDTKNIIIMI